MKLVIWKNHSLGQVLYRRLDPSKKRRQNRKKYLDFLKSVKKEKTFAECPHIPNKYLHIYLYGASFTAVLTSWLHFIGKNLIYKIIIIK